MVELPFKYWNELTTQFIIISVFLSGFSIAVTANLLISKSDSKLIKTILKVATISSGSFLTAVFSFTNILMMTTESNPMEYTAADINTPRVVGFIGYLLGVFSLLTMIALAGWTKSKGTGIFTTIVGVITLILFFISAT